MTPKRFIIHCETNWCGEDNDFGAIAYEEGELDDFAQQLAYENFQSFDGFETMMVDLFGEPEDDQYTEEQLEEGYQEEGSYYSYTIEEFEGDEEEWNWYGLVYDCTKEEK